MYSLTAGIFSITFVICCGDGKPHPKNTQKQLLHAEVNVVLLPHNITQRIAVLMYCSLYKNMRTQKNVYINRKWHYPEPFILLDIVYNSSWVKNGVRTGQIYDEDVFLKADASNIK